MSGIYLHKTLGVNSRLMICPRCGESTNGVALLGTKNYKHVCTICKTIIYGGLPFNRKCPGCGNPAYNMNKIELVENEQIIDYEPCNVCQKELTTHAQIVADGGIYWKCTTCNSEGVLKPCELATEVRKKHGLTNGEPCGVDFEGTNLCPICNPKGE